MKKRISDIKVLVERLPKTKKQKHCMHTNWTNSDYCIAGRNNTVREILGTELPAPNEYVELDLEKVYELIDTYGRTLIQNNDIQGMSGLWITKVAKALQEAKLLRYKEEK